MNCLPFHRRRLATQHRQAFRTIGLPHRKALVLLTWLVLQQLGSGFLPQAGADDWPGWLGTDRDGVYRETGIVDEIPESGLPIKWRKPIGIGYAGPAVADGKVFLFDYEMEGGAIRNDPGIRAKISGNERLTILDAATGETLNSFSYPCPYQISYPSGPRCTPTVDENRVYLLGAEGDLHCLEIETLKVLWKRNLPEDFGAEVPVWGFSAHPLVDETSLYTMVGGDGQGIVAFDKLTGEVQWKALNTKAGYCAPQIIQAGGVRQLIAFHPTGVQGLNPKTGESYWEVPVNPSYEMSVAVPTIKGRRMYVSSIHTEAVMIELAEGTPTAKEVWRGEPKNAVHCSNAPAVMTDGLVIGTDCLQGSLIAADAGTGDRVWETFDPTKPGERRFIKHGTAFLTRIGDTDRYFLMSENGDLIIARLSRDGYDEKGRMQVLQPTNEAFGRRVVWSHPAYASKTAYVRNDKEIVAVDLDAN